jgi:hypothetical protein
MKRVLVLIFVLVSVPLFADSFNVDTIQGLLKNGQYLKPLINYNIVSSVSSLSMEERQGLYYKCVKKDAFGGFILNFLIGFGIGNYAIGDTQGGTITLFGYLLSGGIIALSQGMGSSISVGKSIVLATGLSGLGFFIIRGWVSPFTYQAYRNEEMKKLLLLNDNLTYNRQSMSGDIFHLELMSFSF